MAWHRSAHQVTRSPDCRAEQYRSFQLAMQQKLQPKYAAARLFFVSIVIICGITSWRLTFDGGKASHMQGSKASRDVRLAHNEVVVKKLGQVSNSVDIEVSSIYRYHAVLRPLLDSY